MSPAGRLEVSALDAGYGRMQVVRSVSFNATAGELLAILGRNGAGKSTTLGAICGARNIWANGTVVVNGTSISGRSAADIAASGIAYVPEGRRIFREMSVRENLLIGAYLRRRRPKTEIQDDIDAVVSAFPALADRLSVTAGQLSGGQQQMVAIGQAIMARPDFMLLDEPTSGISPLLSETLYGSMTELAAQGLGVVVVEQNPERALNHSNRTLVMDNGGIACAVDFQVETAIVTLNTGDCVMVPGVLHGWHAKDADCTLAVIMVGSRSTDS